MTFNEMKLQAHSAECLVPPTIEGSFAVERGLTISPNSLKIWWPGTELNRRRQPFQGCALPPELPGHVSAHDFSGLVRVGRAGNSARIDADEKSGACDSFTIIAIASVSLKGGAFHKNAVRHHLSTGISSHPVRDLAIVTDI